MCPSWAQHLPEQVRLVLVDFIQSRLNAISASRRTVCSLICEA